MNCIKCGVEIKEPHVFCENCLADMEKYPVKPNVTVNLPVRTQAASGKKRPRRQRYVNSDDLIRHLRTKLRILWFALIVVFVAFVLVALMLMQVLEKKDPGYAPGQNYGTTESSSTN